MFVMIFQVLALVKSPSLGISVSSVVGVEGMRYHSLHCNTFHVHEYFQVRVEFQF
jgi:hypothetical protein